MSITKTEAIAILSRCANNYKQHLLNKNMLFMFIGKDNNICTQEVSFLRRNFKHLTGIESRLQANAFFNCIIKGKLKEDDIEFKTDGTTELKLQILPALMCANLSANMIGSFSGLNTKLYTEKIAGNVKGSMGFVLESTNSIFVPNTVLYEDIRDITSPLRRIVITFRKNINDSTYNEIVYVAKKVDFSMLRFPPDYMYLKDLINTKEM